MTTLTNTCHLLCISILLIAITGCSRMDYAAATHESEGKHAQDAYAKPGFFTQESDGRLWVFKLGSEGIKQFKSVGEPAKFSTAVGAGPGGMTIRSDSKDTIIAYLGAKPGFYTEVVDGRLWVLKEGSESLEEFKSVGEPAKNTTFVGKGPLRCTVRTDSKDTYISYLASKPGFWTTIKDGRLWVLEEGSDNHKEMIEAGDIAKNITLVGKGPMNISVRSDDKMTVLKWAASIHGFNTYLRDGRIWVFKPGSEHEEEFLNIGEPAKSVTKVGAGPLRATLRAAESDVLFKYIRAIQ